MVSHMHYNLNTHVNFAIFVASKFIICLIDIHLYVFRFVAFRITFASIHS